MTVPFYLQDHRLTYLQDQVRLAMLKLGGASGAYVSTAAIMDRMGLDVSERSARRVTSGLAGLRKLGRVEKHPRDAGWWRWLG